MFGSKLLKRKWSVVEIDNYTCACVVMMTKKNSQLLPISTKDPDTKRKYKGINYSFTRKIMIIEFNI